MDLARPLNLAALAGSLALGLGAILVVAPAAAGQGAAVDQYVPKVKEPKAPAKEPPAQATDPAGGAASSTDATGGVAALASEPQGDEGGGELPGTDFPLTGFVVGLLGLAAAAVAVRLLWPWIGSTLASIRSN